MFRCSYDGCSDDSSSGEYVFYFLIFRDSYPEVDTECADAFEKKMMLELQADVSSYSSQYRSPDKTGAGTEFLSPLLLSFVSVNIYADDKSSEKVDLFYDSDEDKINAEFTKHLQKVSQGGDLGDGKTDAILNCPGCMSLLCLNCQRHSKYKTQYRTMFTFNCKVAEDEVICPPLNDQNANAGEDSSDRSVYKRVLCEICDTPVGLLDSEGVYHLFGVLASHS
ncbi:unnamed protein product [Hydatigera taeniaeformis]|uniref:E2F-associated phosphoprotein n=1 Tax=Hydatigena taeniaeformis TaxID=6205 RepID=A0A0R3WUL9_HYDTA|nr:unnamed protein product [Hydatigera taeniaeformis]